MKNNSRQNKISVIMPVYNTEKYVWQAIDSILSQSFEDFEFIIIDDASTDLSYQICQEYAKKNSRIRLYKNEKNLWISKTRNKLIELSTTDFIAPQDSDDISEKNRLEQEYNFLSTHPDYTVVSGNNIIINEYWKKIGRRIYSNNIKNVILKKSPISQWSSMFRKDIFLSLGWYDNSLLTAEDYDLWLKMYARWYRIENLNMDLYFVRLRFEQTKSKRLKQTLKDTIFVQKRAIKDYKISPNISDIFYHFAEKILLFFPSTLILFLFKKIQYKNEK